MIDQAFENSSEGELGSILELLKRKGDLADIPFFFRGLVHRSEAIRVQVKRIIQGIGWTRVAEEIERLVVPGRPRAIRLHSERLGSLRVPQGCRSLA